MALAKLFMSRLAQNYRRLDNCFTGLGINRYRSDINVHSTFLHLQKRWPKGLEIILDADFLRVKHFFIPLRENNFGLPFSPEISSQNFSILLFHSSA